MLTHMHNHNSGTHSVQQEDINMPEWLQQLIEEGQASQGEEINPYQQSYELGWASMGVSQEYGGMGAPATLGLIVNEAMNGANLGLSMFFGCQKDSTRYTKRGFRS